MAVRLGQAVVTSRQTTGVAPNDPNIVDRPPGASALLSGAASSPYTLRDRLWDGELVVSEVHRWLRGMQWLPWSVGRAVAVVARI